MNSTTIDPDFYQALKDGNLARVKDAIDNGVNIRAKNDYALRYCAEQKKFEILELLITHGANVHALQDYAIIRAATIGDLETVQFLIKHGANIYARNNSAIKGSIRGGYTDVVQFFLEEFYCNWNDSFLDRDIFNFAVSFDQIKICELLLEKGFTPNFHRAMQICAKFGYFNLIKFFVTCGADIHSIADSMLRLSAENGAINIVEYLLDLGANPNTPGALSASFNSINIDVARLLLNRGAKANDCLLVYAVCRGNIKMIEMLLSHNINIEILHKDPYIYSIIKKKLKTYSIYGAIRLETINIVILLANRGFQIHPIAEEFLIACIRSHNLNGVRLVMNLHCDAHRFHNSYPLRLAVKSGQVEIVKLLVDFGADIHAENDDALRVAVKNNSLQLVRLLIKLGCTVQKIDEPLFDIVKRNNPHILEILLENGATFPELKTSNDMFVFMHKIILNVWAITSEMLQLLIRYGSYSDNFLSNHKLLMTSLLIPSIEIPKFFLDRLDSCPLSWRIDIRRGESLTKLFLLYKHLYPHYINMPDDDDDMQYYINFITFFGLFYTGHIHKLSELCRKTVLKQCHMRNNFNLGLICTVNIPSILALFNEHVPDYLKIKIY